MFALTVIVATSDDHTIVPGTLHSTPAELLSGEQIRRYLAAPLGWSHCPLGHGVYVIQAPDGSRIIVPGIILSSSRLKRKRFPDYNVSFEPGKIEAFARSIADERARIEEEAAVELQALTHDLRALSAEIYTAADLVRSDIDSRNFPAARYRTETVIAAQQMLSIRLDIVDFSTGQFAGQAPERIPVYKKVDKVVKCLKPKSLASGMTLTFNGPSVGMTYGPPIFELVPFVLVQNALKYSPSEAEVVVKVSDSLEDVAVHVQSQGPRIRATETERIFDRGYRGIEAQKAGRSGSGLGLFAARTLTLDGFGGTLGVVQDSFAARHHGQEYFRTTFTVRVPRVA